MDDQIKTLAKMQAIKERLNDRFLELLIEQIAVSISAFDGDALIESLYNDQANLPEPCLSLPKEHILGYWRHKIALTERALASAEKLKKSSQSS